VTNEVALAQLRVKFPDGTEQIIPITRASFDIGRVAANELTLPDTKISRHHVRLLFEGDRISLIDMGSRNGTIVNGQALKPNEPSPIRPGESFTIGPYTLTLESNTPPEEPAPAGGEPPVVVEPPIPHEPDDNLPPGPPSHEPPLPRDGEPEYDRAFGLPEGESRYLDYLPPIFQEKPKANGLGGRLHPLYLQYSFFGRFLLPFEGLLRPIEQTVDHFDLYLDPATAPAHFLEELGAWLSLTLDEKWSLEKRRTLVAEASELYKRRGTRKGLARHLEIYTDVVPQITEPENRPHFFQVVLTVPAEKRIDRATIERIIEANKPAHATYSLEIKQSP